MLPLLYSKLYILTDLNANDVNFISTDRQKLDNSEEVSYVIINSISAEIQSCSTNIKMSLVILLSYCIGS